MSDSVSQKTSRVQIAINTEGALFLLFFLGLGCAAIDSGQNGLMLLFCCFFAAVLVFFFLARRNLAQNLCIERRFVEEIYAGRDTRIDVLITNTGKSPVYGIHVFEQFDDAHSIGPIFVQKLNPGQTATAHYMCQFPRRGTVKFEGFQIRSRFPVPFLEFRKDIENRCTSFVYPEPLQGTEWISFNAAASESSPQKMRRNDTAIRELVHGQKSGRILWKLSAKKRTWIESVPIRTRSSDSGTVIEITPRQQLGAEKYETQISQITAYVLRQMQYDYEGEIHFGNSHVPYGKSPIDRRQVLEMLATI